MNIITPFAEVIDNTDPLRVIELAGRCCYQSEPQGEPEKFIRMIIARGHESVLEHAWFQMRVYWDFDVLPMMTKVKERYTNAHVYSGNVRMWRDWIRREQCIDSRVAEMRRLWPCFFDDVTSLTVTSPIGIEFYPAVDYIHTVRFVVDRGVSHEIVRHRIASYSQESTRFCNYGGKGITLVHPPGLNEEQYRRREEHFWNVQRLYDAEIAEGVKPQIARGVLPTCLKTELWMTATRDEWRHVFTLRNSPAAHPQMREVMEPLYEKMRSWLCYSTQ